MSSKEENIVAGAAAPPSRCHEGSSEGESNYLGKNEKEDFRDSLAFVNIFMDTVSGRMGDLSREDRKSFMGLKKKFEGVCHRLGRDKKLDLGEMKKQGAIPKKFGVVKPGVPDSVGSSSDGSTSSSETSSSDDSPARKHRSKIKSVKSERYAPGFDFSKMIEAMQSVGNLKTPVMADFDETSGVDFCQYLKDFETYCEQVIRGRKKFWVNELQARLSGDTLRIFQAARTTGDSWKEMKSKLIQWYQSDAEPRKRKFRRLFAESRHERGESLYMLAIRIETIFKMAFPGKSLKMSETLRDKYLSAIPVSALNIFRAQQAHTDNGGHQISWEKLKSIASFCDGCSEYSRKTTEANQEVVIHLGMDQAKTEPEIENGNYQSGLFRRLDKRPFRKTDSISNQGVYNGDNNNRRIYNRDNNRGGYNRTVNGRGNGPDEPVRRFSQPPSGLGKSRGAPFRPPPAHLRRNNWECYHCGRVGHLVAECRYKNRACFSCGDTTHFVAECRSRSNVGGRRNSLQMPRPQQDRQYGRTRNLSLSHDAMPYSPTANTDQGRMRGNGREGNGDTLVQWGNDQGEHAHPTLE